MKNAVIYSSSSERASEQTNENASVDDRGTTLDVRIRASYHRIVLLISAAVTFQRDLRSCIMFTLRKRYRLPNENDGRLKMSTATCICSEYIFASDRSYISILAGGFRFSDEGKTHCASSDNRWQQEGGTGRDHHVTREQKCLKWSTAQLSTWLPSIQERSSIIPRCAST